MVHESNLNRDSESGRNQLFNKFMQAQTCHQTFTTFLDLCEEIDLSYPPSPSSSSSSFTEHTSFYPRLKKKLSDSWRAQSLWAKLDKRFYGKEYFVNKKTNGKRAGEHMKVAVIGAGPCGLRTAIEMACLGTKVVVLEKRDNFSRNNVLHLWPFIITDLKTLGAKKLYGRFCVGAIDHISIRQLQLILLKIALMLGVEVLVNISFEGLIPPSLLIEDQGEKGWTAAVKPANHPISNFEFDIVVGADGKRNTLQGFKRKEFRGKLAIGLTVNFINRNTTADAKVEEISGVAYIFNQQFFKDLQKETGIDLENIVYYKGETHYFVMTAKKHSLVTKGVLKQDYDDTSRLLSYQNVDMQAMMTYAREAADFSTHHQLPSLEFAINKHGQPDIALFDFTCMYAAENAALFREVNGHKLLSCLVGDSLLEPFWPMGTGCARGFLAAFDTAWMTRQWATNRTDNVTSGRNVELQVLAERESIYRLLHQTTPQNTMKKFAAYTIDPNTRYVNLNMKAVSPNQVKVYYLADCEVPDVPDNFKKVKPIAPVEPEPEKRPHSRSTLTRKVSMVRSSKLQSWCQHTTEGYRGVHVTDMTSSWKSGLAICALIHRFRPDLINWNDLDGNNVENNNQLAFDIAEAQLGISPVMTGKEMQECDKVDKLLMVTYISQFYEIFKHETATGIPPSIAEEEDVKEDTEEIRKPRGVSLTSPVGLLTRIHQHIKRRSVQNKHDDHAKKKKHGHSLFKKKEERTNVPDPHLSVVHESQTQDKPREQRNEIAPDESESMEIGGTNVKLRPKKNLLDESSSPKATVHQRASNRISALSNQLISQWEQNAPQASPRTTKKNKEADDLLELPVPSASDKCYFCQRRVYIVERLSAEGFFFHRQCFVCSHCGLTLRRGAYVFEKDTGKFFCHASCMEQSKTCQHPPKPQTETDALQTNGEPNKKNNFQTPERIELENIRMSMINDPEELSEEALTKHNFSTSAEPDPETMPDVDYMSDSSDDDIDWEDVLRKAKVAGENENKEEEFEYDENDSLVSHSSLEDSEASDASVADLSSHDSLSDIPDENESQEDNEDETLLSSESSSSIGSQDSLVSHDSIPKDIPPTAKETAEASTLKDVKTGSNRDSLSSVSTSSEIEELPREKVQDGRDVTLVVSTNLQTKTGAQQEVAKKSKTIFGLLSEVVGKSENSKSDQKSEKPQKLPEPAKETNPKQINKFETLDRFQDYLRNTPLDDHSLSDQEEGSTEEDSQESFSSSSSISLSSSRSDIDNDALLDLLEEKETKTEVPISLVVQQSLQQHEEEREKAVYPKKFPKTPRPSVRVLPRQSSVDSILLRASNSLKNNTSVWSTFEGHEESTNTDNRDGDVDESLISNYRPCKDVTDSAGAQPRPPLERRLSYDSLERRMKFRLRARNRWLRQESVDKSGRGLTRSHSERTSKSSSTPADDNRSKDDLASYFESRGMVVIESSPPIETYSTPPSKPVEDHEDSFHTPLVDISLEQIPDFIPEAFSISSQKPVARKLNLDGSGNFVLAPGSPADDQKSQTLPTSSRRMLPALPKVPHLEAISPTGSANNTLNRKKKDKLEEDFKAREQRVKERVEKIKAETLKRKKQTLDVASPSVDASKSSREPMKSLDVAEGSPTGSGYSPKPTRKHLFKTKRTKKSKSQEGNLDKKSDNHRSKSVSTAAVEEKKNKGFFRISPRKKHQKKENKLVSMDVVDGGNTLERKYKTQSEREKAILRGERFRILPDTPSTSQPIRADSYDSPDEEESKNYWARKRRVTLAGLTPAQIDAKITRRVQIAARRQAKLEAQKRLRRAQVIQRQLEEVEVKQKNLEERGVVLEKLVRGDGEEKEESNHMQEWFKMVQEKNGLLRYENELMIYQRELQLEDVQSRLQQELRERMAMDDQRKTSAELAQEKEILRKMLDVVEQRDELVALLEEQRLKERDESIDPETLMLNKFNGISEDSSSHSVSSS